MVLRWDYVCVSKTELNFNFDKNLKNKPTINKGFIQLNKIKKPIPVCSSCVFGFVSDKRLL